MTAKQTPLWCLYDDGDDEDGGGDVAAGWGGDAAMVVAAETAGGGKARGGECGSGLGRSEEEEHIWCSSENPSEKFSDGGVVAVAGIRRRGWFPAAGNPGEGGRDNERLYTSVGNPVKEILLKLNLPDHRILKDGGEDFCYSDTERLSRSDEVLKLKNFKKDATLKFPSQQIKNGMSMSVQKSQYHKMTK
ncbi:hypothetical protein Tco_1238161 [Tanacetum coccineum]